VSSILVIGGSRGAGKAIALAAGKKGANVIVVARKPDDTQKTSLELLGAGVVSIPILADAVDLGDRTACDRVLTAVWRATGKHMSGLVLATPAVRAGTLGPLATVVRRGAQQSLEQVVAVADDPKILEEIETALEGVPRQVGFAAVASSGEGTVARALESLKLA
jgi:NAD(P)-dependent dehydrogenase (short-subunit alcohol dehydrogenase family)